ncbi:acetyltransferase [Billgrantia lactosivorans]|uniref:acetyltransferase n=1 Tax=Billgrantia lactosivorans TaxID=2185141 RepID=UPI000DAF1459|nr:acetyltransferase [Halomonas lactosivorans]
MVNSHCLAIFGASGHGKVVADIALQTGWDAVFFYDDAWQSKPRLEHWKVHGGMALLLREVHRFGGVVVAVGNNSIREIALGRVCGAQGRLVTLIHPKAAVSPLARVEVGGVVMPGAVVNAFATIGRGGIVNSGATVDHDCRLGACVHIAPGAHLSGNVVVGRGSWIGVGAVVRQGVTIGERAMIGAGAAVVTDIADDLTVVGVPARPLEDRPAMVEVPTGSLG